MRSRVLSVAGIGFTAVALAASLTGTANAAGSPALAHQGSAVGLAGTSAKACFSNMTGDAGNAVTSQNFESAFDAYDNAMADDQKVTKKCKVKKVVFAGQYYNGVGPATSETITWYKNKKGLPGKTVFTDTVNGTDTTGFGSFEANVKTKLKKGSYWFSPVINMDFGVGGQWGWENTTNGVGAASVWQNPGDGFATGCTTWADAATCLAGALVGPDFMFEIQGKGK